ncbi:LysR substrate-binding domain-containing protein [Amylibacter sp. IMCC11727]|uniref:LysR substrate-binding domain-containing protein n=1 Tax=Amylibacter sp. IMCC11727 TaxID=3039851 RepID=UPI00244E474E|nr:LysR substrate-binding domain-containing protein [Amylibacter sp. IMCC11727]WGI21158.1 LysR substrate-binding domain-containing protein [Amylibacter sp. IMCC11727]
MTQSSTQDAALREAFLGGMSHAACTVNIVTTDGVAGRAGVTVSAMTSVSADTPKPTLLVCVHHEAKAAPLILENGNFCVNLLRDDQSFISDTFAGRFAAEIEDKFDCANWANMQSGSPRVVDPLVAFDCAVISAERIGTHHVFVGEVQDIFTAKNGSPLIYANRAYGRTARIDPVTSLATSPSDAALRIGCFHTFGPFMMPEIIAKFAQDDSTDLRLMEGDHRRLIEGLRTGELDLALMTGVDLPDDIEATTLSSLPPYILLAEDHPLAAEPNLTLETLTDHPMVLLDVPPSGDYFLQLFAAQNLTPQVKYRCPSYEMVRGLVGQGLGFSILGTKPATNLSYNGKALITRPLPADTQTLHTVIATKKGGALPKSARPFISVCRTLFSR